MTIPHKPDLGIAIDEKAYELECKPSEIIVA